MSKCPIQQSETFAASKGARCPVAHESDDINPFNQVPLSISQSPAPNQSVSLSVERECSSIPCATSSDQDFSSSANWVYPSPQQFYNALVRKGYEMPQDQMGTMVQLHNFLNEEAWAEVLIWERRWDPKLSVPPELAQIRGKPQELSFKARSLLFTGWLLPSYVKAQRPFDRHDWLVRRASGEHVRYIIDYYSAPPDEEGNPVFILDVRPASDCASNIGRRVVHAAGGIWGSIFNRNLTSIEKY